MSKQKRTASAKKPPHDHSASASGSGNAHHLRPAMRGAAEAYMLGDWAEAERLCRFILYSKADYFDALNLLGAIAAQTRRAQEAVELFGRAVAAKPKDASAHSNLGNALKDMKRFDEALESYDRALKIKRAFPEARYNRGAALQELKRFDEALVDYDQALALKPDYAEAYGNRGLALHELRRLDEALHSFDRALRIKPDLAEAYYNRGNTLKDLQRPDEALESYERAIKLNPRYAGTYYNRGNLLKDLKRLEDAIESYDCALTVQVEYTEAYYNRGLALQELKRFDEALDSYGRALKSKPDFADAYHNRGLALQELKRFDEALDSCDRALKIKPDYAEAYSNRGLALQGLQRLDDALDSYDSALKIKPDFAEAYNNRGLALQELRRLDEALDSYDRALTIKPDFAEAYSNRGNALKYLNRLDEALESYDQALTLKPDHAEGQWNLSLCRLSMGDFARGWNGYEWRWLTMQRKKNIESPAPLWEGQKLHGSLLVVNEQGVGDEIFFAGMLKDLQSYANAITVCVDPRLVSLFSRSFAPLHVISVQLLTADMHFDAHVFMGDLGRYLRTGFSAIAGSAKPYLRACPERTANLRAQIAGNKRLVCGLSWSSNNQIMGADKSLRLQDLDPILSLPGIDFIDLQYGDTGQERADLYAAKGLEVRRIEEIDNFNDIDGLAALISACDVIVTVSNTTAHLAAALGKPVYLMLPFSTGLLWYWHVGRSDSPWYPTARLFRQPAMGDWVSVTGAVRDALRAMMAPA